MCLFDLVKQHHAVRAAAHGFGQLPALVMTEVARRRTQQPGGGVLLLILRHIKFEQRLLAAEPADRKRPRQCGLAHAGRPQKQHSTDGPPRFAQTGAAAPDSPCHGRHCPLLANNFRVQAAFQLVQTLPLLLAHPLGGHAAGRCHHPGDILRGEHRLGALLLFGKDARRRTGFVHKVNGLIRQTAPGQVPHRKLHCRLQGLGRQAHAMIPLVAGRKAVEDLHRLRRGGFFHLHPAKAALQRGVLLDVGAKLLIGSRADKLQLAPGKHRF